MLSVQILASGSSGNALLVSTSTGSILVDAGINYKDLLRRMGEVGANPERVRAVFLTHEHTDHVKGLQVFLKHFAVPVFAAPECLASKALHFMGSLAQEPLKPGQSVCVAGLEVTPFRVPHDAAATYGYCYQADGLRVGHATDFGVPTEAVVQRLRGAHCLLLEFNHDLDKLAESDYPTYLKLRIKGDTGHLSNGQGAQLLSETLGPETLAVYLMHLSRQNNEPLLARMAAGEVLGSRNIRLETAEPFVPSPAWTM